MARRGVGASLADVVNQVQGVISARVVTDESGDPTEIAVLAQAGRSPRQVIKDVESALIASLGKKGQQRRITVAQVEEGSDRLYPGRLQILGLSLNTEGPVVHARVRLGYKGQSWEGESRGSAAGSDCPRLVACATLAALEAYFRGHLSFGLHDLVRVPLGSLNALLAVVCLGRRGGEEFLTGSSLVRNDEAYAAVRATLDAVNRVFSIMGREEWEGGKET